MLETAGLTLTYSAAGLAVEAASVTAGSTVAYSVAGLAVEAVVGSSAACSAVAGLTAIALLLLARLLALPPVA